MHLCKHSDENITKKWILKKVQGIFQETVNRVVSHVMHIVSSNTNIRYIYANEFQGPFQNIDSERLIEVWKITEWGMCDHLLTHYVLYFLSRGGTYYCNGRFYSSNEEMFSEYDKYGMEYDLYLSFLSGIKFYDQILDFQFVQKHTSTIKHYLEILVSTTDVTENEKIYFSHILDENLEKTFSSEQEQKYMLRYLFLADLLGLVDVWFMKDFSISSVMIESTKIGRYDVKPLFMLDIFNEIFGKNQVLDVTQENYQEIKEKIQKARENFLIKLWVQDFINKKEISQKLLESFWEK